MDEQKRTGVRHRGRGEADKLVSDYLASGLTQKRWCRERGIGPSALRYWLKRQRQAAESYSLVPVQIDRGDGGAGVLDLRVNGLDLRVGAGSDLRALAALLRELA